MKNSRARVQSGAGFKHQFTSKKYAFNMLMVVSLIQMRAPHAGVAIYLYAG